MFGNVDKNLGHFRRYNKEPLENLLKEVGFKIEKIHYSNFLGIFGWFVTSKLRKKERLSYWQILLFDKLIPFIEKVEKKSIPHIGLSIVAIGRK